jgi:HD-GYP domain-containing protein (c-di-GMP phosphodiesterase class II)
VPDAVLNKAGPLSDEEWALMKEHPAIGLRILEGVPRMGQFAPDAVEAIHQVDRARLAAIQATATAAGR